MSLVGKVKRSKFLRGALGKLALWLVKKFAGKKTYTAAVVGIVGGLFLLFGAGDVEVGIEEIGAGLALLVSLGLATLRDAISAKDDPDDDTAGTVQS